MIGRFQGVAMEAGVLEYGLGIRVQLTTIDQWLPEQVHSALKALVGPNRRLDMLENMSRLAWFRRSVHPRNLVGVGDGTKHQAGDGGV